MIFTRKAGGAADLASLKGKKIALVSKTSAAGYVLPIVLLKVAGAASPMLPGNHAAVCKAVLDGSADAGATFGNDKDGKTGIEGCKESVGERASELRVLAASAPIPNDVMAARPGLPAAEGFLAAADEDFLLFRGALAEAGESP